MSEQRLTKNQRREQARLQAKLAREAQAKRDKRNLLLLQGGVLLAALAVIAIVALVIVSSINTGGGANPKNMASGGVTFGKDLKVVETPALAEGAKRTPLRSSYTSKPVHVQVYVDFMCPICGNFEKVNGPMLEQHVGAGDVELEIFPVNFLDATSLGSKYSTRAGNALACLADEQPNHAYNFHKYLFEDGVQPQEGTAGLTDQQLLEQAIRAGAQPTDRLKLCIKDRTFGKFIDDNYNSVSKDDGVLGLAPGVRLLKNARTGEKQPEGKQVLYGTPLVIVNGEEWSPVSGISLENMILQKMQGGGAPTPQ